MRGSTFHAIAGIVSLTVTVGAYGDEPFLLTAQTTSGPAQSINTSGSSLPDLVNNLVKSQSQFSSLQNRDISSTIRYGGVNNAVLITRNASNTSASLSLPGIGFTKTFTGKNENDLEKQIENYAKKNGSSIYGKFIRSINETSDIGVTDGNPLAATALLTSQSYMQFGLQPTPFLPGEGAANPLDQVATPNIRLDISGGYSHSDTGSSYFAGGAFSFGFKFGDRVGLVFATPFTYRNVEGADVFNIGEEISLPVLLVKSQGNRSLSWMLTPTFIAGAAGSVDLASGGTFLGGGLTSSLSFTFDSFVFTLADGIDYFHGFPISAGQYKFETDLDQEVLKNGIKVSKFFGNTLFIDGSVTYSNFLQKAALNHFWSPAAGLGFRFGTGAGLRIGYTGDFSRDFVVHGGDVQLYFNF